MIVNLESCNACWAAENVRWWGQREMTGKKNKSSVYSYVKIKYKSSVQCLAKH